MTNSGLAMNAAIVKSGSSATPVPAEPELVERSWLAELHMRYRPDRSGRKTVADLLSVCGPLKVQRGFYPEMPAKADRLPPAVCHSYILHPPGGIVSGDRLAINITVAHDARALITTTSATRIYRVDERQVPQRQKLKLEVASGATLEWLPLENIFFAGSRADFDTEIILHEGSALFYREISCLGRPASGIPFDESAHSFLRQRLRLMTAEGSPIHEERIAIHSDNMRNRAQMGEFSVTGSLLVHGFQSAQLDSFTGAVHASLLDELREAIDAAFPDSSACLALTSKPGLLICRYLGHESGEATALFDLMWHQLRPHLLDCLAVPPRIWAT
ncbi:MAG: urease accessory protein [unclassified Hahellaceae]|nr:urease accessory protein [Hahellaceae bacterium]|tara:strand:+ start:30553 stop:31545 length:993 start_codon:yes stop_codon:yes gene_type:complete